MKNDNTAQKYPGCDANTSCGIDSTSTAENMASTYIRIVPTDPSTSTAYTYNPGCTGASCALSYTLTACLENKNDPQRLYEDGNASDPCGGALPDGKVGYRVQEP